MHIQDVIIEKGVPLPPARRTALKEILLNMETGDSFKFEGRMNYRRWASAASVNRTEDKNFTIRCIAPSIYRLWCIGRKS
jgi:hypothetical protein